MPVIIFSGYSLTHPSGGPTSGAHRHASLFSQLLNLINRQRFHELVFRHQAERYAKRFSSWDHFVAMLFCQLAQAKSLREICGGLACCLGKLRHLAMRDAPKKSTLSYANAHRTWQMFEDLFYETLNFCRQAAPAMMKGVIQTMGCAAPCTESLK